MRKFCATISLSESKSGRHNPLPKKFLLVCKKIQSAFCIDIAPICMRFQMRPQATFVVFKN